MKCPNCGGEHCQFMSSSKTKYKAFGALDACCGFILLGPAGLLCGFCGADSSTTVNEYWICHDCGRKFSSKEAAKIMEEERNKIPKFHFYLENSNEVLDSERQQWERVQDGINEKLESTSFSNVLVTRNPTVTDHGLERIKTTFCEVMDKTDLTYCIITAGEGAAFTNKGLAVKDHVIPYGQIEGVYLYGDSVYVNQTCIRMSSDNQAGEFYGFLKAAVQIKDVKEVKVFDAYEELLHAVQESEDELSSRETHFSTQKEYEGYLGNVLNSYFQKLQKVHPQKYAEYQRIKSDKDKTMKKARTIRLIGGVVGVLILSLIGGILGFFLGLVILGFIPWVIVSCYFNGESWNAYKDKYLDPEIPVLMKEQSRSAAKRVGDIEPEVYRNLIQNMEGESEVFIGSYCTNCGKPLEANWGSCPYCGSDRYKGGVNVLHELWKRG